MVNDACELCSSTEHHVLLCNKSTNKSNCCSSTGESNASRSSASKRSNSVTSAYIGPTETNVANGSMSTIYPKTEVQATDRHHRAMVFYDGRSNSTYVTQAAVCRLNARKIGSVMFGSKTLGCIKTPYASFSKIMVVYFGPFKVKDEVQKRITGKAWVIWLTVLGTKAKHIEAVYGYSTWKFMLALMRLASLGKWLATISSYPKSWTVGTERELTEAWSKMHNSEVQRTSLLNGRKWKFEVADSPWRRGAVKALVKPAKHKFALSMNNQRVSLSEFKSIRYQVVKRMKERPIGTLSSSNIIISLRSPNILLISRSLAENPGNLYGTLIYNRSLVNDVTSPFWMKWQELYTPTFINQPKSIKGSRDLVPVDVAQVGDSDSLRKQFYIPWLKEVFPGTDRKVGAVYPIYMFKIGKKLRCCYGSSSRVIIWTVRRLGLLLLVWGWMGVSGRLSLFVKVRLKVSDQS